MYRRNEFDVENRIDTTNPDAVSGEVCRIFEALYDNEATAGIRQAFGDLALLYRGEYPGYYACDTAYHDLQHVLDVTLAMARLMDGAARSDRADVLTASLFQFGVVVALYHDCGYIRHRKDTKHANGAEYTKIHISRGGRFLEEYMGKLGMQDLAQLASRILHFTGYEVPVSRIRMDPEYRLIGNLLGSADILAQMSDRCYLEKCYDRLYPEFVFGGIARGFAKGRERVVFASATDLIRQTPRFYEEARKRLDVDLGGCARYGEKHFGGENLYVTEIEKNVRHARRIAEGGDVSMLRRSPPETVRPAATEEERLF